MGILDTIIILFSLVFVIIGFIKGFMKQVLSSCAWIFGMVAATSFCKQISNLVMQTPFGMSLNDKLFTWISNQGDSFTNVLPQLSEESLSLALSELNIPKILHSLIIPQLNFNGFENMSIAEYVSPVITSFIFTSIAYVLIYLVVFLLIKLLSKIFGGFMKGSALGFLDSVLGSIWGLTKAVIIISITMFVISLISTLPFAEALHQWIEIDVNTTSEGIRIAKFFYENNPILKILELIEIKF